MRFVQFLLGLAGLFVLSLFLTPVIYQWTDFKFERILARLITIFGFLWIVPFAWKRILNVRALGLRFEGRSVSLFFQGFLIGSLALMVFSLTHAAFGVRQFSSPPPVFKVVMDASFVFVAAFVIGLIEEFFFRGLVFTALRDRISLWPGLWVTNFCYALVHFLKSKEYVIPENPTFVDSFWVVLYFLKPLLQVKDIFFTFLVLFGFGIVLTQAFLRARSLFLPIGIHAGCVFLLKMDGAFLSGLSGQSSRLLWGINGYDGLFGILFILIMAAMVRLVVKPESVG